MRCPKLVLASNGLIIDFGFLASCLVQIFPGVPILLVLDETLPDFVSTGEILSRNHGVGRDEEEGGSRDDISCPIGFILGIFKRIGVIGDVFRVQMVVLNFILQCQHIEGMEATTLFLQMVQEL